MTQIDTKITAIAAKLDVTTSPRCNPTCKEFLEMAARARLSVPIVKSVAEPLLCVRDATDVELVHLVHDCYLHWGSVRGLGSFTRQQAICLHMASGTYPAKRVIELEEIAKSENASALSEPAVNSLVSCALNTCFSTPRDVHEYTPSSFTSGSALAELSASCGSYDSRSVKAS